MPSLRGSMLCTCLFCYNNISLSGLQSRPFRRGGRDVIIIEDDSQKLNSNPERVVLDMYSNSY